MKPFSEVGDLVRPLLYQVDINEGGTSTYRDIPLRDCPSDDTYTDLRAKSTLLCADFEQADADEGDSELDLGVIRGAPGHLDSSYLIFTLVTVTKAALEREFFEEHRVVAFASQYSLSGESTELGMTSMKQISASKLSVYADRVLLAPISRDTVTWQSDSPALWEPDQEQSYPEVARVVNSEAFFSDVYKRFTTRE